MALAFTVAVVWLIVHRGRADRSDSLSCPLRTCPTVRAAKSRGEQARQRVRAAAQAGRSSRHVRDHGAATEERRPMERARIYAASGPEEPSNAAPWYELSIGFQAATLEDALAATKAVQLSREIHTWRNLGPQFDVERLRSRNRLRQGVSGERRRRGCAVRSGIGCAKTGAGERSRCDCKAHQIRRCTLP